VGDATDISAVGRLMAGDAADLIFTNPPYNVAYEGYTEEKLTIKVTGFRPNSSASSGDHVCQLSPNRKGGGVSVCLPSVLFAAGISECNRDRWVRDPLPGDLGKEHLCLGFRAL
jgi:hypothetical protein